MQARQYLQDPDWTGPEGWMVQKPWFNWVQWSMTKVSSQPQYYRTVWPRKTDGWRRHTLVQRLKGATSADQLICDGVTPWWCLARLQHRVESHVLIVGVWGWVLPTIQYGCHYQWMSDTKNISPDCPIKVTSGSWLSIHWFSNYLSAVWCTIQDWLG